MLLTLITVIFCLLSSGISPPTTGVAFMVGLLVFLTFFTEDMSGMEIMIDSLSVSMVILSCLMGSIISLLLRGGGKLKLSIVVVSVVMSWLFFMVDSLLLFFIFFELSLLPLFLLIMMWGHQGERLMAAQFMVLYTMIASSPLFISLFYLSSSSSVFSLFNLMGFSLSPRISAIVLLAFFVKIPIFFFHSWLPKAHVEAPLEGSMILAGLMLKVGVYGLIRVIQAVSLQKSTLDFIMSWGVIGSVICVLVAMSSDDVKMSVAFSSVSHMNFLVGALMTMKTVGLLSAVVIMVCHGVSSPILFAFVTKLYERSHSRSSLINKGSASKLPLVAFVGLLVWLMNISPPPLLSFVGEWGGLLTVAQCGVGVTIILMIFFLFSSFYSVVNYGIQCHSSFGLSEKSEEVKSIDLLLISVVTIILFVEMFVVFPTGLVP